MTKPIKLHEWQKKQEEVWVRPRPCVVCSKVIPAPYGRDSGDNWTCSKAHEEKYRATLPARPLPEE